MIIGFTEGSRTVSERQAPPGFDLFPLPIGVATLRRAERKHPMNFRLQVARSSAIVEPLALQTNPLFDALFGNRDNIYDPIKVFFELESLEDVIPSLTTFIRDDPRREDEECFTIRIFPADVKSHRRELFSCNEDDSGADNYFCLTEICIEDDGRYVTNEVSTADENNRDGKHDNWGGTDILCFSYFIISFTKVHVGKVCVQLFRKWYALPCFLPAFMVSIPLTLRILP